MTRDEIIILLRSKNPSVQLGQLVQYADMFLTYSEACKNIAEHGAICAHPRTGNPIENPYLKVQATAMKALQSLVRVRATDELWKTISQLEK